MKKNIYSAGEHFKRYLETNKQMFRMNLEIIEQGKDSIELRHSGFIFEIRPFLLQ